MTGVARFAVVGSGIAGLSAAWELQGAGHDVVVFEATGRTGGKLQRSPVPGLPFPLDEGADAFLARVPDALELCDELGIDSLVHPATGDAWIHAGEGLHPLPKAQLLGVPTDLDDVAASGLLSPAGVERARQDLHSEAPPPTRDLSVGELIRTRLGDEVCDHLVEPLLGGINGGEADGLSARAAAAQIWAAAQQGGSLIRAAAATKAQATGDAPVFAAPAAGMAELPSRLRDALRADIRTGAPVSDVAVAGDGVEVGGEHVAGVVVATPADVAATILTDAAPGAAALLGGYEFASVVLVTVVADADRVEHPMDGSGFVVSRTAGASITAASWGSSKWAHWNDGEHVVFRISLGHDADPVDWCAADDEHLVTTALGDLRRIMDTDVVPVGTRVRRWARSFPQYRPGHLERVEAIRGAAHEAGPVALAGMSYDGIGVPASIRSGRAAARHLLA